MNSPNLSNAADVFATFDIEDPELARGYEDREMRQRKYTPHNPAKPKPALDLKFAPDAHLRGNRARQMSYGKTTAIQPSTPREWGGIGLIFEGGFAEPSDNFVTPLVGRPRIHLTNAEKQRAYRERKSLISQETIKRDA